MLFKKVNLTKSETLPSLEKETNTPLQGKPIYILGNTPIACFLAAKFTSAGIRTIILATEKDNTSLSTNGITIKEDYQLQKLHCRLETALWQKEEPLMVLIATTPSLLKSSLLGLSKSKLKSTPIISFTPSKDDRLIADILGYPVTKAYFDGWLKLSNQQVFVYGQTPKIILCSDTNSQTYQTFNEQAQKIAMEVQTCSLEMLAFWNFFSIYAPCSLITAASGKNIFEITKKKTLREQLLSCLEEISLLPPQTLPAYTPGGLLKQIFNIPSAYEFPLAEQIQNFQSGDLDFISSVIQQAAFDKKKQLPTLNLLLKSLYEQILKDQAS